MFDIIVKGGTLPDGRIADIGIEAGRIKAIGALNAEAGEVIDAAGDLVAPPFVDPHFHLDATQSYGRPASISLAPYWKGSASGAS